VAEVELGTPISHAAPPFAMADDVQRLVASLTCKCGSKAAFAFSWERRFASPTATGDASGSDFLLDTANIRCNACGREGPMQEARKDFVALKFESGPAASRPGQVRKPMVGHFEA